jgi:hypothetical protein
MLSGPEPTPKDSNLVPEDFDFALRRMKTDLALLDLRRSLLHDELDAPAVLAIAARILELQQVQ